MPSIGPDAIRSSAGRAASTFSTRPAGAIADGRQIDNTGTLPMNANANAVGPTQARPATIDIGALDVSERWKTYFKGMLKHGGLKANRFAVAGRSVEERVATSKELRQPFSSCLLAFMFGLFYYLAKGMWRKGLVLLLMVLGVQIVLGFVLFMIGGEALANATGFLGGAIFAMTAPRDFYAFKVEGDQGWMPVRPF